MEKNIEIKYTKSAEEQLGIFKSDQVKKLEKLIVHFKMYPGAEFIEITGADIQKYTKDFIVRDTSKSQYRYMIVFLYMAMGIGLMAWGLFYQDIAIILDQHPNQIIYIVMGFLMFILGSFLVLFIKNREKERIIDVENNGDYTKYTKELINLIEEQRKQQEYINIFQHKLEELQKQLLEASRPDSVRLK